MMCAMRYPPDHKAKTRAQILTAAAHLFRKRGIEPTGVDGVMSAVGLTAGGFYAHFPSKDALLAEAIDTAGERSYARWFSGFEQRRGRAFARELVARYLSSEHRDERAEGCLLPALGAEMARQSRPSRRRFQRRVEGMFCLVQERTSELALPRDRVIAAIALSVGAVVLARAVVDRRFSDEILAASRRGAARLLGLGGRAA
jgi:TetR/AcrR family transcriptional repressor of nem operon